MSPHAEILQSVIARLRAQAVASGRVYDRAPASVAFPHVEIGEMQTIREDVTCLPHRGETFVTIHVWARPGQGPAGAPAGLPGSAVCKQVNGAVVAALHEHPLALPGWIVSRCAVQSVRDFIEPDGVTQHGVITLIVRAHADI
jgi:hypothetical protein